VAKSPIKFGVINQDSLSLYSPRAIDGDECDTLTEAIAQAGRMIADQVATEVAVVRCRFSQKQEVWVEVVGSCIEIDSSHWEWEPEV